MSAPHWHELPEDQIFQLVERLDTRGPRYTSYPTVPVWRTAFPPDPYLNALRRLGQDGRSVAVYLHLPFCRHRCLYCGCNSYITQDVDRICKYTDALKTEIARVTSEFRYPVRHAQLHLGGGTPTYVPAPELSDLLDFVIARIPGSEDAERSIEVDPRVTTDEHLTLLAKRGFTRISAGLQDLDPQVQQAIRREFSFDQMRDFVARARQAGFVSVNIDLIYGLPRQNRSSWRDTLRAVVELKPDRLACFGYAHLPQKIKHQRAIHDDDLPSARERLGMLLDANRHFGAAGYAAIGMDHFALPNDDLSVARREGRLWRNFMGYTTIRGLELLGLGCSGISEFNTLFAQNITPPELYSEAVDSGRWPIERGHELDFNDRMVKQIINHLMCNLEIAVPREALAGGEQLLDALETALDELDVYVEDGLIERTAGGYRVTSLGQLFVRNLAMPFDRYLPKQTGVTFSRTV